jgi:hypothetical protein
MPLQVDVEGADALIDKLDQFAKQISDAEREMPEQLMEWQRDDMRRKFPTVQTNQGGNETVAQTSIWPRSRTPERRQLRAGPKQARPRVYAPRTMVRSTRPILRIELYRKLVERMTALIVKAMKWP